MESKRFKTDIKCAGCLAKVSPFLNEAVGEQNWEVDIQNPQKTLVVAGDNETLAIQDAVRKAGFKAEPVN